jgi:uncharacterized protein (TIGR02266 family)
LVDPNTRQGKRTPVTLKIKFKSETLEQFIERYAVDVSQGGIFIRTKEPLAVGTQMKFEFQLRDASPLIAGEGTVVWTRENDPSRPAIAPGMGVRFDRLADGSQSILERILAEKVKQAPQRPAIDTTRPPLFTDTPTRVAPAPMQEALLGQDGSSTARPRSQRASDDPGHGDSHTPLPKPMPFHSDADEFPDEAFEEATKVRALDELIAQTAGTSAKPDELAARKTNGRADSTLSDPSERAETLTESADAAQQRRERNHPTTGRTALLGARTDAARTGDAYDLPNPPEPAARVAPKLLDTSPSPRMESGLQGYAPESAGKTRLGVAVEPARPRASTPPPAHPAFPEPAFTSALSHGSSPPQPPLGMRAVAAEQTQPARMPPLKPRSSASLVILGLLVLAAGGAAAWFFVLRPRMAEVADHANPPAGSASAAGSAIAGSGSAGAAEPAASSGSAGSADTSAPKGPLVDTVITSSAEGARVEVKDTDLAGPAPFTAKLEAGKPYKVRVTAHGFATLELDVKGGDKPIAKLVAKPRIISITSEPPGALILIDSVATGHTTPWDVELSAAQAAKKSVKVQLRKSGYRTLERVIDATKLTEDDTKMVATIDDKLVAQQSTPATTTRPTPAAGSAKPPAQGSDGETPTTTEGPVTTPSGDGASGNSPPPPPAPTPPPAAPAAPTPPPAGPTPGSASEPEPTFNKQP